LGKSFIGTVLFSKRDTKLIGKKRKNAPSELIITGDLQEKQRESVCENESKRECA